MTMSKYGTGFLLLAVAAGLLWLPLPARAQEITPAQLYERVSAGVVSIVTQDEAGKTWIASGSVVDPSGVIVTSYHVVSGKRHVHVKLPDGSKALMTQVIGYDVLKDIVVFTIDASGLTALPLGDSDGLKIGETVYVVGNPQGMEKTLTDGLVSTRQAEFGSKWIMFSAAVGPGSSGSPLVNQRGEVVGVVSSQGVEGMRLSRAAEINQIKPMLASKERIAATAFLNPAARPMKELLSKGLQAFAEGKAQEAINYLEQVKDDADSLQALVFLGASYLEVGDYGQAIEYLKMSQEHFPEEPLVYRYLGSAYMATGTHRNAVSNFQKFILLESQSKQPNYELISATHLSLGYAYLSLAEFDKALKQVEAIRKVGDEKVLPDAYLLEGLLRNCQADLQASYGCVEQLRKLGKNVMADQLLNEISNRRRRK